MNGTLRTARKTGGGPGECVTWAPERGSDKEEEARQSRKPGDRASLARDKVSGFANLE